MKIGMISLGCAKNLVNSEQMAYRLKSKGCEIIDAYGAEEPDILIVNTCAFIESAQQEAIDTILELSANNSGKIIATGCLPQLYGEQMLTELPELSGIVGTGSFGDICAAVDAVTNGERPKIFGDIDAPADECGRLLSTGPGWAYIKIAEGCDNRCAYCLIPDIRGRFRSRPMENIVAEAERLVRDGVRELIVVAQDISRYGLDFSGEYLLPELLRRLCRIEGLEWLRLHYLYPDEITDELIDTVASEKKVLKYLDIPIQHINDKILASMNRRGTGGDIRRLITRLREKIPGLVLRTSVIAGLPGEGEAEFEELCEFLLEYKIERAGVFAFSPQEGTPAAEMPRPDDETTARRVALLTEMQARICDEYNAGRIGQTIDVLGDAWQGSEERGEGIRGRSFAESPDIDGYIHFEGDAVPGEFVKLRITGIEDGELTGEVLPTQSPA